MITDITRVNEMSDMEYFLFSQSVKTGQSNASLCELIVNTNNTDRLQFLKSEISCDMMSYAVKEHSRETASRPWEYYKYLDGKGFCYYIDLIMRKIDYPKNHRPSSLQSYLTFA